MAAREKSLWVQVMEAGFGATLEAHGFRRVSPRLYRLEGDGIVWEQFTYRGPKGYLNAIREGHGAVVDGLDEMFRRAYGGRPQDYNVYPVRNGYCGRQYHAYGAIDSVLESVGLKAHRAPEGEAEALLRSYDEMRRQYEESRDRSRWARLRRFLRLDRRRKHFSRNLEKITPHFQRNWHAYDANFWGIGGSPMDRLCDSEQFVPSQTELEELAGLLSRFWTELVWTYRIGRQLSIHDRAVAEFNRPPRHCWFDRGSTLFNHLAGRHDLARSHVMHAIECGRMTPAQVRAHLEEHRPEFLEREPSDYGTPEWDMDSEDLAVLRCKEWLEYRRKAAVEARRLAAAIGLTV
ncbi:MAG: hypothetical protein OXF89_18590 [Rhodospirillaceae bacterium]|nr:hypothetical protein [Rhodospirillaceae bacterium]MCY4066191.1 hypothetical protein [Rhodospirillaceae bacterium]